MNVLNICLGARDRKLPSGDSSEGKKKEKSEDPIVLVECFEYLVPGTESGGSGKRKRLGLERERIPIWNYLTNNFFPIWNYLIINFISQRSAPRGIRPNRPPDNFPS